MDRINSASPIADTLLTVHPLEIWLLNYRAQHSPATLSEVIAKSANQRQEVYSWLFQTRHRTAQDRRIRMVLEEQAFKQIWLAWKRQGYPFDSLVPSYATAIGVSGDTPAALADLMGIILNEGIRYPNMTIRDLRFAQNTPVEAGVAARTGGWPARAVARDRCASPPGTHWSCGEGNSPSSPGRNQAG